MLEYTENQLELDTIELLQNKGYTLLGDINNIYDNSKEQYITVNLIDYDDIQNNSFHIAQQMTFKSKFEKRQDLIIYINGLPLSVIELKNPNKENTGINSAYN